MTIQEALSVFKQDNSKAELRNAYAGIIANLSAKTISQTLKNKNLSGSPDAATFEVDRITNSTINPYGTARAAGAGAKVKIKPIYVNVDRDREIAHEIENKDLAMGNIADLPARKMASDELTFTRELEKDFFSIAAGAGRVFTTSTTDIADKIEEAIQAMETTSNDFVDGIERDLMTVICDTATYGSIRKYLDVTAHNANVDTAAAAFNDFHGAKVTKSIYLPKGVEFIVYVDGAVAQPVRMNMNDIDKVDNFSDALGWAEFMYYGTKAVAADTILVKTAGTLTLTSVAGATGKTTVTSAEGFLRGATLYFKTAASVTAPAVGDALPAGYTAWDGEAQITATSTHNIVVIEVSEDGKVIRAGKVNSAVVG